MAADTDEVELITVGKPTDDGKAVWDQHPSHPENYEQAAGEVFISDMRPFKVFRSAGIQQKLGEKPPALRELRDQDASQRLEKHTQMVEAREKKRQETLQVQQETAPPGATYIAPAAPVVPPQEPPEGEAEAAEQAAEERRTSPTRRAARTDATSAQPPTQPPAKPEPSSSASAPDR